MGRDWRWPRLGDRYFRQKERHQPNPRDGGKSQLLGKQKNWEVRVDGKGRPSGGGFRGVSRAGAWGGGVPGVSGLRFCGFHPSAAGIRVSFFLSVLLFSV